MEIAMVAIRPAISKLGDLLVGEFTLEKRVRQRIESLVMELTLMHAVLRKVDKVPPDQLDEGIKIWAGNVKELSYRMEDIVDAFLVRVEDGGELANPKNKVKTLLKKTVKLFKKGKNLHRISDALEEVVGQSKQLAELRQRYEQEMRDTTGVGASVDRRFMALYADVKELVGIEEPQKELIRMLLQGNDWSMHPLKTVSIVGFGGLGKTTLAKTAYDKIKVQFDCAAFVSVSQNPDTKKVFKNILYELDKNKYANIHGATLEDKHLIDQIIEFLTDKRYLIVIDDIWDEKAWQLIKCAFSKKSAGSRLITTTRIISVSEACCSSSEDIYRMKPLSHEVSRRLFNKRVFSHEKGCPPELVEVSEGILQKCGGIPLAVITIASILANNRQIKGKDQWYVLLNSIGRGLTEDPNVEEMKKILLFSYYDLPSYLKPCLLYISIYPEDQKIKRKKLVWKWISEGFVYSEKQETNLYELGDSYFNELVNRCMIQPIGIDNEEKVKACRVHDMVLDLVRSLASEGNFVTILDGSGTERKMPNSQSKARRLSVQNSKIDVGTISMAHVRSLTVFSNDTADQLEKKWSTQVVRVLDLEDCNISDTVFVGNLLHLRYLDLNNSTVEELPMEIGKLQFLQTLDIRGTSITELLSSVVRLRRLMCLCIGRRMKLPSGIGNLTNLEVLVGLTVTHDFNQHLVKELGQLTRLRVLRFYWVDLNETMSKAWVESLNSLHKLEILDIHIDGGLADLISEAWVPPPQLRRIHFDLLPSSFRALPAWINPSSLHVLSYLHIPFAEERSEDIQVVGILPALRFLRLGGGHTGRDIVEMLAVTPDSFPCVTDCQFDLIAAVPSTFPLGAAPRLERLVFAFMARWISRGDTDLRLGHLPALKFVNVQLLKEGGTDAEVEEAKAALRVAADDHPNRPNLKIHYYL